MSDDYIRLAAPTYPEMQYCYSPVYDNFITKGGTGTGTGLISSPRTKRTHYRLRKKENIQLNPPQLPKAVSSDIGNEEPAVDSELGENATVASLHPSIESPIDPSPQSSLDVDGDQASFPSLPPTESQSVRSKNDQNNQINLPPPINAIAKAPTPAPVAPASAPKRQPVKSALSAMIAARASAADNPFNEFSFVSGRGDTKPFTLCVYLPHSSHPYEPISLVVRPDAIVDDVIGYILYDYVEKKLKPPLQEEMCDIAQWEMRIVEDDGEIEDELPALDRTRQISMFSFVQFALCRTSPEQAKENAMVRAKMGRTGPKIVTTSAKGKSAGQEPHQAAGAGAGAGTNGGDLGPLDLAPSGPSYGSQQAEADSSAVAVPIPSSKAVLTKSTMPMTPVKYFRIRLMTNEEVSATTTIPVYAEMFIGDVLELISRKRKLDPDEYMLTIADSNMIVSNDTPVDSMGGVTELCLVRKGTGLTIPSSSHIWRSPNKRKKDELYYTSEFSASFPSAAGGGANNGILSQYKKYLVYRKNQVFVGRRECILAIDGDYIHILPPEHKGMFDSAKTTTLHVSFIISCKQSKKAPTNFKIAAIKDQNQKVYDFEAMNAKESRKHV
ncbi:stress-activated map kinase interacting protein 1-domain-containing protein [Dichotomocladium elegans]|nr:stress-activated map kinase interacting protein 1-domain-containing protein [Dichotomocladium elegans]